MALSTAQLSLIEQRIANDGPSPVVAYLLWFFLWFFSGHRFYLGRPGSAIAQILTYFILIGFVWVIIDAFLIPGMIRDRKEDMRHKLMTQFLANSAAGGDLVPA
jgi:TM2 domain-containing membrane protein YozV